eukprot:1771631-Amphidinium_carterae.1
MADQDMGNRPLWEPPETSRVYQQVAHLVPWQLGKVQVNRHPKVHRHASDPHTHRISALLYNDNSLDVIVQDLSDVSQVRARFAKPVLLGLFIAGVAPVHYAPDELTRTSAGMLPENAVAMPAPAQRPGDHRVIRCSPGITIEVQKSSNLTEDEARIVAKLHSSMGHPDAKALHRLLGQQKIRPVVHEAIKGLKCEYCDRHRPPAPPPQVGLPRLEACSFGEHISGDLFFLHLPITDEKISIMGWICHATNLHSACVVHSREPEHLLEMLLQIWLQPFGYPSELWTDYDGGFRSIFSEHMTANS